MRSWISQLEIPIDADVESRRGNPTTAHSEHD